MKTRKHNLSAIAVGVALATASLSALAATPLALVESPAANGLGLIMKGEKGAAAPTFNRAEQTGLCLMESVVSLLAARTNDFGGGRAAGACVSKTYDLSVFTTDNAGVGQAEIGEGVNLGGTTLNAVLGPTKDIGTRCKVDQAAGSNLLGGVPVLQYAGTHGWSRTNEIFNSDALIQLRDPQTQGINRYREVDIKDYFKYVSKDRRSHEFDFGIEDIKKYRSTPFAFYYPVQKWYEVSDYVHENGGEGYLSIFKFQVIPKSAFGCTITVDVPDGNMFNGSGEFEATGTVTVGKYFPW